MLKWFYCPHCGYKLCKTNDNAKGGVFAYCSFHKGEVEVKHQKDDEQNIILEKVEKIKKLKKELKELQKIS